MNHYLSLVVQNETAIISFDLNSLRFHFETEFFLKNLDIRNCQKKNFIQRIWFALLTFNSHSPYWWSCMLYHHIFIAPHANIVYVVRGAHTFDRLRIYWIELIVCLKKNHRHRISVQFSFVLFHKDFVCCNWEIAFTFKMFANCLKRLTQRSIAAVSLINKMFKNFILEEIFFFHFGIKIKNNVQNIWRQSGLCGCQWKSIKKSCLSTFGWIHFLSGSCDMSKVYFSWFPVSRRKLIA